jgi:hypothetical protein
VRLLGLGESILARNSECVSKLGINSETMFGLIFQKAQNRIQDPAKLTRLIRDLIDRKTWLSLDVDVKGDANESLDDAASLEEPDVIAADIIEDLQTALDEMSLIYADLAAESAD